MAEQLAEGEARIEEDKDRYNELVVLARQRERELRQVRRELTPLTQGMAVKTKRDRVVRIRNRSVSASISRSIDLSIGQELRSYHFIHSFIHSFFLSFILSFFLSFFFLLILIALCFHVSRLLSTHARARSLLCEF